MDRTKKVQSYDSPFLLRSSCPDNPLKQLKCLHKNRWRLHERVVFQLIYFQFFYSNFQNLLFVRTDYIARTKKPVNEGTRRYDHTVVPVTFRNPQSEVSSEMKVRLSQDFRITFSIVMRCTIPATCILWISHGVVESLLSLEACWLLQYVAYPQSLSSIEDFAYSLCEIAEPFHSLEIERKDVLQIPEFLSDLQLRL